MLGETFSHYRILEKIGEGGMGEVYLADDLKLRRKVALKVLPEHLTQNADRKKRFIQEARAAAAVDHPNLAAIFDVDEDHDRTYIVMEYVRGLSLRDAITTKKFDPEASLKIALLVVDALKKVHASGIVHRDLKPENILVSEEGYPKLIDFGLAKLLEPTSVETDPAGVTQSVLNTREGHVMGTVAYMSPEQAKGQTVDGRTDIFSFGVILYEMLTGERVFRRATPAETLGAILRDEPPPLKLPSGRTPRPLQLVCRKALEKDRDVRYQDFGEVSDDLAKALDALKAGAPALPLRLVAVAAGLVAALVLAIVVAFQLPQWIGTETAPPDSPISVLIGDFDNRTGDALFDGALEQAIGIGLEGATFVATYPRGDARAQGARIDGTDNVVLDERLTQLVCRSLGIHVAVVGEVEADGDAFTIRVRAIDPLTSDVVAEASEDGVSKASVLRAADDLATRIRNELFDRGSAAGTADAETFLTDSLEAMHAYSRAQDLYQLGRYSEAIDEYRKAIAHDADFGRAYSGLASQLANFGEREEADKYFQEALARIDKMTERGKYRTRGAYYLFTRDHRKAIEEYRGLVDKFPADAVGYSNLALAHFFARDFDAALDAGRRSSELFPDNLLYANNLALFALYASDFESAQAGARAALEINPSYGKAYVALALAQLAQGDLVGSENTYRRLAMEGASARETAWAPIGFADVALYRGNVSRAVDVLEQGIAGDVATGSTGAAAIKRLMLARAQFLTGDSASALASIEAALESSRRTSILVPAALMYVDAGRLSEARGLSSELANQLQADPQAYAAVIEAEIALAEGDAGLAVRRFREAADIADTWLGRFGLARAYVEAGAYAEAHSELEQCIARRGEVTAVFLDDIPSYHLYPDVHYYMGRAQQGLGSKSAGASFASYIEIRSESTADPYLADARNRALELGDGGSD